MPLLIGTFGNFLIPLQIGAGDMAFPLLNELSYWLYVVSGILILRGVLRSRAVRPGYRLDGLCAAERRWKMSTARRLGQSLWCVAIFINGLSSIAGATNYITTMVNMRAPGMTMFRMPLSVWSLFITAILLRSGGAGSFCSRARCFSATSTTAPASSSLLVVVSLLLWQHLFWFFGHPEVLHH